MSEKTKSQSRRWRVVSFLLAISFAGIVIWDGADRRAADPTKPLLQGGASRDVVAAPTTLKLGSFNIHSGKGTDGIRDLSRTAGLLKELDFVGVYEVRCTRDGNQAADLANRQSNCWLFAPTEQQWWTDHFGNGLLYKIPVHSAVRIPLENTRGKAYRNAILSTVELQRASVRVLSVHIDRENDRQQQLQSVIDLFLGLQSPCVLMGDLNSTASDPLLKELRSRPDVHSPLHESLGESAPNPSIDWIFTRGLKTISAELVENSASDHALLKAELAVDEEQVAALIPHRD